MTDIATIVQAADHLERTIRMAEHQRDNASDAGFALAVAVYRYVESPQEVGTASLQEAYSIFMAEHAGNFNFSRAGAS